MGGTIKLKNKRRKNKARIEENGRRTKKTRSKIVKWERFGLRVVENGGSMSDLKREMSSSRNMSNEVKSWY